MRRERRARLTMLLAADAAGRTLLRRPSWEERETLAAVDVPLGTGRTPFARFGDVFGAPDGLALAAPGPAARRSRPA